MANQSNLPTVQRLKYDDVARKDTWQDAMKSMIETLNLFVSPVYDILNGGITAQNVVAPQIIIKTITGATTTTFTFMNPLRILPTSVMVGNVWTGVPNVHPSAATQVFWHVTNNNIIVDNVTGLVAGTIYQLTLVVS